MIRLITIGIVAFFITTTLSVGAQSSLDSLIYNDTTHISTDSAAKANVNVHNIIVTGNRTTKTYLILREIPFKISDSIVSSNMKKDFELARQLVYNTTLFDEVKLTPKWIDDHNIDVLVEVKERWYIYPIPQFQLADRNFNEWYKTYDADLNRVNYGVRFIHYNLSGRKDILRINLLNGYSKNVTFSYTAPYSNSALTEGFTLSGGFSQNKEIIFKTSSDNHTLLFRQDDYIRKSWFVNIGYTIRKGYFKKHFFNIAYTRSFINDSIITPGYNPNYFKKQVAEIGMPDFSYAFQYTKVDNVAYPLAGKTFGIGMLKRGLSFVNDIDLFMLEVAYTKYWPMKKKWYGSIQVNGKIKLPFDQAYINQRGLGYGESYLRGLEYYVIDGVMLSLLKSTLKKELFSFSLPFPFKSKLFQKIPITVFAKTYLDAGYVYNKKKYDANLNDRLLYTSGIGIDILTFYDASFRIEYSFNQLNEKGLFLHAQYAF